MEWHHQLVTVVGGMVLPHCTHVPGVQPQQVELSRGREFKYKEQDQAPSVTCSSSMEGHVTYAATGAYVTCPSMLLLQGRTCYICCYRRL